MSTTLTIKGQVTIPKQIRDALGLKPGMPVDFAVNHEGQVVIHRATGAEKRKPDRFEAARGKADVKWRTKCLFENLLRDLISTLRCSTYLTYDCASRAKLRPLATIFKQTLRTS